MKQITVIIRTENAAFYGENGQELGPELSRILRRLADDAANGFDLVGVKLRDINGNIVGEVKVK